ncbi:xanthine dehydrogenase family protein molybdopterin-binding subunit [Chondromyces apiculatus]|uniref:Isoquinoline 1-oxidoreductase beta subunit n=1 Tax=Chondromyces apiculatus DSM 436 TaxID=1192034 RepID=A0A017SW26_9BACT|nr:xanthine dehydrogenase family protein molybdopterin-binding subunit [Chondromyces apiculatus]EYF01183.1 Isoquinoline 1-oxidoreductase beta subunit [Chondromyces apiculatus DSM 436]
MNRPRDTQISRRGFMRGAGASLAGLVLSFYVPEQIARAAPVQPKALPPPNAFVRIAPDDTVTVVIAHSEMGQGIWTTLAMLIAEELECDWAKVRSEHAPAAAVYIGPAGGIQMTGGSSTTRGEFERYRQVGAAAKDMLLRAAAARWKVPANKLVVEKGVILNGKQKLRYGEVAEAAMKLPPPASVKLKEPQAWKLIGKPMRRLDSLDKITGKATFGIDVTLPDLRTAVILRPPAFGAKLVRFDGAAALKVPGVEKVVPAGDGVAVVAKHFWAAKLGRDALVAEWQKPEGGGVNSDVLLAEYRKKAQEPGTTVASVGDAAAALSSATTRFSSEYELPYLAHAPMEPLNCTVKIDGDRCEIWTGTQFQTVDQKAAATILGTTIDKVQIHTTFLGGGFGRRANPRSDFVAEAVTVAKAAGVPVKVVWTREDDIRGGYYRPAYVHRMQVATDAKGNPSAWDHVVVGQSILKGTPFEGFGVKDGIDNTSVEGLAESPYLERVSAKRVSLHTMKTPVTVLWWRSVGNTHTAFAIEGMIDELAHAAKRDPLEYRLALLDHSPRFAAALKLAAEKAGWEKPAPEGRARGLAVHESFGSIVAEVAEVSITEGRIKVHEVTCAVDCGSAVNPLGVEAQIQGSVVYGLTAALYGKLTLKDGQVQESNFHDYPPLRMFEMPKVSVHIIQSGAPMGGIGEPATAPIAPAVANAVFALTQKRLRSLPLRLA